VGFEIVGEKYLSDTKINLQLSEGKIVGGQELCKEG